MNGDRANTGMQDLDGTDVVDANGETIGSVQRTYDDPDGTARLVDVKIGTLFAKHRLIPLDNAETTDQGLQVPYDKQTIEGSPDAGSAGDTLEGEFLDSVTAYYSGNGSAGNDGESGAVPAGEARAQSANSDASQTATETPSAEAPHAVNSQQGDRTLGAVRDLGDVIEVPIIEEEIVTRPVVRQVLRIRKRQGTEQRIVQGDIRNEEIEVVNLPNAVSPEAVSGDQGATAGETNAETPNT